MAPLACVVYEYSVSLLRRAGQQFRHRPRKALAQRALGAVRWHLSLVTHDYEPTWAYSEGTE